MSPNPLAARATPRRRPAALAKPTDTTPVSADSAALPDAAWTPSASTANWETRPGQILRGRSCAPDRTVVRPDGRGAGAGLIGTPIGQRVGAVPEVAVGPRSWRGRGPGKAVALER